MTPQEALSQAGCVTDLSPGQQQAIQTLGALALLSSGGGGGGGGGSNQRVLYNYDNTDFGNVTQINNGDPIDLVAEIGVDIAAASASLEAGNTVRFSYDFWINANVLDGESYLTTHINSTLSFGGNSTYIDNTLYVDPAFQCWLHCSGSFMVRKVGGVYEYISNHANGEPYTSMGTTPNSVQSYFESDNDTINPFDQLNFSVWTDSYAGGGVTAYFTNISIEEISVVPSGAETVVFNWSDPWGNTTFAIDGNELSYQVPNDLTALLGFTSTHNDQLLAAYNAGKKISFFLQYEIYSDNNIEWMFYDNVIAGSNVGGIGFVQTQFGCNVNSGSTPATYLDRVNTVKWTIQKYGSTYRVLESTSTSYFWQPDLTPRTYVYAQDAFNIDSFFVNFTSHDSTSSEDPNTNGDTMYVYAMTYTIKD